MERKSRVSRYQELRSNIDNQPSTPVKSNDLYNYSQRLDAIQPQRDAFSYQQEDGDLLSQLKEDDQTIDNLINQNDALLRSRSSRADRFGMNNQNDPFNFNIGDEDKPTTQMNQTYPSRTQRSQQTEYQRPVSTMDPYAEYMRQQQQAQNRPQPTYQQPQSFQQPQTNPYNRQPEPQQPVYQKPQPEPQRPIQPQPQEDPYARFMSQQQQSIQPEPQPQEEDTDVFATLFADTVQQQPSAYQKPAEAPYMMDDAPEQPTYAEPDFDINDLQDNYPNEEPGNPFLEQAIMDAKNYSIERGDRAAVDTSAAVISDLNGQNDLEDTGNDIENLLKSIFDETPNVKPEPLINNAPIEEVPTTPVIDAVADDDLDSSFFDDEDDIISVENLQQTYVQPQPVVTPAVQSQPEVEVQPENYASQLSSISDLTQQLDKEHILRNDLEQQTKQMKLEMDGLGSEVDVMNKKMNRTNRILNFVLVVLIVFLFLVLAFIVFLALVDRGIIKGFDNLPITILPHILKL